MDSESPQPPESRRRVGREGDEARPRHGVRIGALIALAVAAGSSRGCWSTDRTTRTARRARRRQRPRPSRRRRRRRSPSRRSGRSRSSGRWRRPARTRSTGRARGRTRGSRSPRRRAARSSFATSRPARRRGDLEPHLTVATYARPNGYAEVQAAAKNEGSQHRARGGGLAVYDAKAPTNVHLALPGRGLSGRGLLTRGRPGAATRVEREDPARPGAYPVTPRRVVQWGDAARAAATASSRELTPRARKRRRMWFLTVSVLRWSSAAICFVEQPCSRRRSTSTWRGVRCGGGAGRCRRRVPRSARRRRPPFHRS